MPCGVTLYGGFTGAEGPCQTLCVSMTICILYNFLPGRWGGGGTLVTLRAILEGRGGKLHFPLGPGWHSGK